MGKCKMWMKTMCPLLALPLIVAGCDARNEKVSVRFLPSKGAFLKPIPQLGYADVNRDCSATLSQHLINCFSFFDGDYHYINLSNQSGLQIACSVAAEVNGVNGNIDIIWKGHDPLIVRFNGLTYVRKYISKHVARPDEATLLYEALVHFSQYRDESAPPVNRLLLYCSGDANK